MRFKDGSPSGNQRILVKHHPWAQKSAHSVYSVYQYYQLICVNSMKFGLLILLILAPRGMRANI
jgi:hypothetical protein